LTDREQDFRSDFVSSVLDGRQVTLANTSPFSKTSSVSSDTRKLRIPRLRPAGANEIPIPPFPVKIRSVVRPALSATKTKSILGAIDVNFARQRSSQIAVNAFRIKTLADPHVDTSWTIPTRSFEWADAWDSVA
jgi:hypothetical protein